MSEQIYQQIDRLRKSGDLSSAWDIGCPAVQNNTKDVRLKSSFFWVCYDYLKEVQGQIKSRAASGKLDAKPSSRETERIDFLVDWIIWLELPDTGFEYRNLLLIFQQNLEHFPKLLLLLTRHMKSLFRPDDKLPFISEKGESPSLMLKFTRKLAKCWVSQEAIRQLTVDELIALIALTRREVKDKQQLIWLDYDESRCLIAARRYEEARKRVLPVLRKKQDEAWAWGALAATYRKDDPKAAISLFSKALSCAHDDTLALPTLKGFATLLASEGFYSEASACVQRAIDCYIKNGWQIKSDLEKLLTQSWFKANTDVSILHSFLKERSRASSDYLFGERVQKLAIVQNIHPGDRGFHIWLNRKQSLSVRMKLWKETEPPKPGDYVLVTVAQEDLSVIAITPTMIQSLVDAGEYEDILKVTEKGFAFVGDTFVPKHLISDDLNGQRVRVFRITELDKAKNRYGWRALKLSLVVS